MMVKKKISMKDIADEMNLSITTVSFIINGKTNSISPATVTKVKELIKKRGFKPNSAARMLRTGKSKTIGLIIEDNGNFFFGNVAKIIESEARKNGYNVFASSTDGHNETARELINKMKAISVDGFIITATKDLSEEIEILKKENIPFVLLDRLVPEVEANYVILDNYKGAYDLTKHLVDNKYKNIGYITIADGMSQMIDRQKGFLDCLSDSSISISSNSFLEVSFKSDSATILKAIKKYITDNKKIDALFFATNYLGVLGIEAIQQCNLNIPKDIAVVSFDDNDLFRLFNPSITVASQPIDEIATKSIELLLKMVNKEQKTSQIVGHVIQPSLIIRNSSPKKK